MNHLDLIRQRLLEKHKASPAFIEGAHELLMSSSFLIGVKRDIEALMPIIKDPALDDGKIELMGFNVIIDDSLKDFEFRIKSRA